MDERFITITMAIAHWAEPDYGLGAGQHAVLPEGRYYGCVV